MKRLIATTFLLALGTAALAQAPESPWRSPFTAAPSLSGVSPLNAEKNRQVREQELAAWKAAHLRVAATPDRPATAAKKDGAKATAAR
jgi:hypothetical protein